MLSHGFGEESLRAIAVHGPGICFLRDREPDECSFLTREYPASQTLKEKRLSAAERLLESSVILQSSALRKHRVGSLDGQTLASLAATT